MTLTMAWRHDGNYGNDSDDNDTIEDDHVNRQAFDFENYCCCCVFVWASLSSKATAVFAGIPSCRGDRLVDPACDHVELGMVKSSQERMVLLFPFVVDCCHP